MSEESNNDVIGLRIIKKGVDVIKQLEIFTVFQVAWLIEIYYLAINILFNYYTSKNNILKLPYIIKRYNNIILSYFKEYYLFIGALAIGLILCGCIFTSIKYIRVLYKCKYIKIYCYYGIYYGIWLLLIWITYALYLISNFTILILPIIALVENVLRKINL